MKRLIVIGLAGVLILIGGCDSTAPSKNLISTVMGRDAAGEFAPLPLPKSTDLRVGQSLVVVLPTNRAIDAVWRLQEPLPAFLTLVSDTTQSSTGASIGGSSGTSDQQVFTLQVKSAGDEALSFLLVKRDKRMTTPLEIRTTRVIATKN